MFTIKRKTPHTWIIEDAKGQVVTHRDWTPFIFGASWAAANFCLYYGLTPYWMPELDAHWVHP